MHLQYDGTTVTTTPTHPFYQPQKGWIDAIDLRAGDILVKSNGEYVVVEMVEHELLEAPITVYNFEVEDFHTYYVGDTSVLVHNKCDAMTRGRQMHKQWDYGQNKTTFKTEVSIPGAGRADAVDFVNHIVYELKPDNLRAIRQGWRQLNRYVAGLEAMEPGSRWIKILVTYK